MDITIKASNGKQFHGTDYESLAKEVNAYEADLKLAKQAELERQKKAEEERKSKEEYKKKAKDNIYGLVATLNEAITNYEKNTGKSLYYRIINDKLVVSEPFHTWEDILGTDFDQLLEHIRIK